MDEGLKLQNVLHQEEMVPYFSTCVKAKTFADVTFVCKDKFMAFGHKLLISSVSKVLSSLFESQQHEPTAVVMLPDFDLQTVQQLLEYMYTGTVQFSRSQCLAKFLDLANVLQVPVERATTKKADSVQTVPSKVGHDSSTVGKEKESLHEGKPQEKTQAILCKENSPEEHSEVHQESPEDLKSSEGINQASPEEPMIQSAEGINNQCQEEPNSSEIIQDLHQGIKEEPMIQDSEETLKPQETPVIQKSEEAKEPETHEPPQPDIATENPAPEPTDSSPNATSESPMKVGSTTPETQDVTHTLPFAAVKVELAEDDNDSSTQDNGVLDTSGDKTAVDSSDSSPMSDQGYEGSDINDESAHMSGQDQEAQEKDSNELETPECWICGMEKRDPVEMLKHLIKTHYIEHFEPSFKEKNGICCRIRFLHIKPYAVHAGLRHKQINNLLPVPFLQALAKVAKLKNEHEKVGPKGRGTIMPPECFYCRKRISPISGLATHIMVTHLKQKFGKVFNENSGCCPVCPKTKVQADACRFEDVNSFIFHFRENHKKVLDYYLPAHYSAALQQGMKTSYFR